MGNFTQKMFFLNTPAWVFQLTEYMPLVKMVCLIVPVVLSVLMFRKNYRKPKDNQEK